MSIFQITEDGDYGPSPWLWSNVNWLELVENGQPVFWDDFLDGGAFVATDVKYNTYLDSGCTAAPSSTQPGATTGSTSVAHGEMVFTHDGTDNDATLIQTAPLGYIVTDGKPFVFEARIRVSSITADQISFACGLIEGDMDAATGTVHTDNTGVLTDKNWIAFYRTGTSATTALSFGWKADGQTAQAFTSSVATLAASTFVKVGFLFNPFAKASQRMTLCINGAKYTTQYVTQTNMDAATFPDDVPLSLFLSSKITAGSITPTLGIDWWRAATLRL